MSQLRSTAKHAMEAALARSGAARLLGRATRSGALILAYHNVVPEGSPREGDSSLHLLQRQFAAQLDALMRTHDVVPLPALLEASPSRSRRPRAAITFDDAYRGAVTAGVAELARRGLPATLFVAPAFVGGASFWWDALAPTTEAERERVRATALHELEGDDVRVRAWARRSDVGEITPHPDNRAATEAELRTATRHPGITLASHTWSHPNLARIAPAALEGELVRPLAWLRERFDATIPWLAYPYGLSSPEVERAAAAAGYTAALRVSGGRVPSGSTNRFALPRLNVPAGISQNGFFLRLSGL